MSRVNSYLDEALSHFASNEIFDDGDEARAIFSDNLIDTSDDSINVKTASCFERVSQSVEDYHQDDDTPDVWLVKKGKIIRTLPNLIKG
ncbi:MAG: hypothetical protein Q7R33_03575 [Nitrosarchaeum sp.]|nr:hypothetical protein [Nitrosarchaeum sp.]